MTLMQTKPRFSNIPPRESAAAPPRRVDPMWDWSAVGAAGLILYGLSRRSWTGSLLAAAGGWYLLSVVQASAAASETHRPTSAPPSLPISEGETVIRAEREPNVGEPFLQPVVVLTAPLAEVAEPIDGPLAVDEHYAAEIGAYFISLERGGGSLPPYSAPLAQADFCRAAGEVEIGRRRR